MDSCYVYILSNFARTTFYIGVTSDLSRRLVEHRLGYGSKFVWRYNLKYLVYFERFANIRDAIAREKQLKAWHWDWKIALIQSLNPTMEDPSGQILLG